MSEPAFNFVPTANRSKAHNKGVDAQSHEHLIHGTIPRTLAKNYLLGKQISLTTPVLTGLHQALPGLAGQVIAAGRAGASLGKHIQGAEMMSLEELVYHPSFDWGTSGSKPMGCSRNPRTPLIAKFNQFRGVSAELLPANPSRRSAPLKNSATLTARTEASTSGDYTPEEIATHQQEAAARVELTEEEQMVEKGEHELQVIQASGDSLTESQTKALENLVSTNATKKSIQKDISGPDYKNLTATERSQRVNTWFSQMDMNATFLGLRITANGEGPSELRGVHRAVSDALKEVEKKLRKNDNRPLKEIREELGVSKISGLRAPGRAKGRTQPSLHCYGLAVDIGYRGNPYLLHASSAQIIQRATTLVLKKSIDLNSQIKSPSFELLRSASDALKSYLALRKPENEQALLGYAVTPEEASKLKKQVQTDYETLVGKEGDFKGDHDPDSGFFNLSETLVSALESVGFSWGGRYCQNQDMMHFDLRNITTTTGTIRRK